ncbi:MAG: MarR family transcriptional regulator [Planctomyces sp.]|nr:MarR family transcriptional regulator [Planctomyces sp.]
MIIVAYKTDMSEFPELPCFCGSLRRVERLLTRHYEEHVRPSGVSMGQLSLLMIVDKAGPISQQRLGDMLAMDKATLSRNLRAMLDQNFLEANPGDDRRTKQITITPAGREKKEEAAPLWQAAQEELKTQLGDDFTRFLDQLNELPERIKR